MCDFLHIFCVYKYWTPTKPILLNITSNDQFDIMNIYLNNLSYKSSSCWTYYTAPIMGGNVQKKKLGFVKLVKISNRNKNNFGYSHSTGQLKNVLILKI